MNKKIIFYGLALILVALAFAIYFFQAPKTNGLVLGSSINSFYQRKAVEASQPPSKKSEARDPVIYADYAVLIEDQLKYPLYQKGSREVVPIASITKVMTALVALDLYEPDDVLTVSSRSAKIEGSKVGLRADEKITFENIIYGLMMNSGNDAAETIAENAEGDEDFVKKMNEKAHEIGMDDTVFFDPAGLNDDGRSTAFDIAVLFSFALKNEFFKTVVSTPEKQISSVTGEITHDLKNSNRLITSEVPLDGVIGGKTGFTLAAGHGLVSAAEQNGVRLICVVLKTHSSANDASAIESRKLLSWGFESYIF